MTMALIAVASTGAGVALALYVLAISLARKKGGGATTAEARERAKASFRVGRSSLLFISGRGGRERRKNNGIKGGARRGNEPHPDRPSSGDECGRRAPWLRKLTSSFERIISHVLSAMSLGLFQSPNEAHSNPAIPDSSPQDLSYHEKKYLPEQSMESYYDDAAVVGLDCEMVGGGRGGWKSLLARCSVVTLDHVPCAEKMRARDENATMNGETTKKVATQEKVLSLDQNLVVLYDKYVVPRGKITDYRTEWSGISKDTYRQSDSPIPIVSFNQCQNEISQLFSSIEGKRVIVVGHALGNDFEALEVEHPPSLTRDTAFYPPYMRPARRKMFPRKLSVLASEELGIEIQQQQRRAPSLNGPASGEAAISGVGHSSVEDATAALRLYWHSSGRWERYLGYPLERTQRISRSRIPIKLYLDGCNLPVGMRGVNFKELLGSPDAGTTIPLESFRLTSRIRDGNNATNISTIDWISIFRSALSPQSTPRLESVSIVFDGAKFGSISSNRKSKRAQDGLETKVFCLGPDLSSVERDNHGPIRIEITRDRESADDVLYHRCSAATGTSPTRKVISLERAIDILSGADRGADAPSDYVVIRRRAGGTKTHRRLFDRLHLRRPNEGALCLSSLTEGLARDGRKTARWLARERGVGRVVECELRRRDELRHVVVTDDVLLADRLVGEGALVLSFRQLMSMF